jgi:hypothetical protein
MFVYLKERKKLVGFIFVIVIEFSKIKITEIFQKNIFQNSAKKLEQEREFFLIPVVYLILSDFSLFLSYIYMIIIQFKIIF